MNVFIHTYTPLVSILRNLNLIHNLATYFTEIEFNNIILFIPRSSNLYRPSKFYDENFDAPTLSSGPGVA